MSETDKLFDPYVVTPPYTNKLVFTTTVSNVATLDTTLSKEAVPTVILPNTAVFEFMLFVRIVLARTLP